MYGICNLSIIPLRAEPNDRSEQVSQVLFGEYFQILESKNQWIKIKIHYDEYEGWIDSKQYQKITEQDYQKLSKSAEILSYDLIEYVTNFNELLMPVPLGASLTFLNIDGINKDGFEFEGLKITLKKLF